MKYTFFITIISLFFLCSCLTKNVTNDNPITGFSAVTTAELAGDYQGDCVPTSGLGTAFNNTSYYMLLNIGSNETYQMTKYIYTGANCGSGGTWILSFTHLGTLTTGGLSGSATKLDLVQSNGGYLEIRNSVFAADWKTLLDAACVMNFPYNDDQNMNGKTCTDATLTTQAFGWISDPKYNLVKLTSTGISIGLLSGTFQFGQGSYPSSVGYSLTRQ